MSLSVSNINYLYNPIILGGVFYNLLDRDLKTLGQTSKKMNEVVKKEIETRDQKFKELLISYLVTRQFNILNAKLPSLLLVGDVHGSPYCIKALSKLVGYLSRRAPVLFLSEGAPSMMRFHVNHLFRPTFQHCGSSIFHPVLQPFPDEPILRENVHCLGWDHVQGFYDSEGFFNTVTPVDEWNSLIQQRISLKFDILKKADEVSLILPEELQIAGMLQTRFGITPRTWQKVVKEAPQHIVHKMAHELVCAFITQFSNFINENLEDIKINRPELLNVHLAYLRFHDHVMSLDLQLQEKLSKEVENTRDREFPIRTASMVSTLRQIDPLRLSLNIQDHFTVVYAGTSHFEKTLEKQEYDLSSFYKELENHKAMILVPLMLFGCASSEDKHIKIFFAIFSELVCCIEKDLVFTSDEVQEVIKKHHHFCTELYADACMVLTKDEYVKAAQLLVGEPESRNRFALFHPQLAVFMAEAMKVFADKQLS